MNPVAKSRVMSIQSALQSQFLTWAPQLPPQMHVMHSIQMKLYLISNSFVHQFLHWNTYSAIIFAENRLCIATS